MFKRQKHHGNNVHANEEEEHPLRTHGLLELPLHSLHIVFNLPILTTVFGVHGIVLYPYILFALPKENMYQELIQHELIHARQIQRDGFFYFYLRYALEVGYGILQKCYSSLIMMISSWFYQNTNDETSSSRRRTSTRRSTLMAQQDRNTSERTTNFFESLMKGLNQIMTKVSYEKEAYSLEHIELYESEKAYLKEHLDGLDIDELMSESEWHASSRKRRNRKTKKNDDEWEDVDE
ncbi:hypothetical protein C9374_010575 [Naegleria lovaniensis]|uniref:Uncharacterized protein n=1 Tax=Naegleria lovaniensis TaxID=51637 RepID=A0AA88KG18_NAELO|nr:uncharacterized protein C9374_010575 [Naegleria lovaniensis]KAG2374556.1 hypothetical protein C9374_010575 [Naegleria lovaniensis]